MRGDADPQAKGSLQAKGPLAGGFGKNTLVTTNDLPGCPKGGLLLGTDKPDKLDGGEGDDEVRALGGEDTPAGGKGNDVVYGGPGSDDLDDPDEGDDVFYGGDGGDGMWAGGGEDVLYGGDGNDMLISDEDGQRDKLYCGKGKDRYLADNKDVVDSSCEKKAPLFYGGDGMWAGTFLYSGRQEGSGHQMRKRRCPTPVERRGSLVGSWAGSLKVPGSRAS